MLAADIDESAQTIVVNDGTVLSDAPNIASIGAGPVAETILYGAKEGNVLSDITRGFGGTTARSWAMSSVITRRFTAYDHNAFVENIDAIASKVNQFEGSVVVVATSGEFAVLNPVLLVGQSGYETDTGKVKIGDGATPYVDLPFFAANAVRTIFLSGGGDSQATSGATVERVETPNYGRGFDAIKYPFDSETNLYYEWTFVMPSNYDGGSFTATFYWTVGTSSPTGDVVFGIQGCSHATGASLDQAWGDAVEVTAGVVGQHLQHVSLVPSAVTLNGAPQGGDLVQIRVYRNTTSPSDTCNTDVFLQGVVLTYHTTAYSDV